MLPSMLKWLNFLAFLGCLASLAATSFARDEKDPHQAFQGDWIVHSITYGNFELKGTAKNPMRVNFNQDRMVTSPCYLITYNWSFQSNLSDSQSISTTRIELTNRDLVSTIKLNQNNSPLEIDILATNFTMLKKGSEFKQPNPEKIKAIYQKGIYRFNQEELEISLGVPTGVRPADFSGSNHATVIRLIREKK